jgi:hypothetical protein
MVLKMAFALALIAAGLFILGDIVPDVTDRNPVFWLLLGLAALSLAFAFDYIDDRPILRRHRHE